MFEFPATIASTKYAECIFLFVGEDGSSIWSCSVAIHFDIAGGIHSFIVHAPPTKGGDVGVFGALGVDVHGIGVTSWWVVATLRQYLVALVQLLLSVGHSPTSGLLGIPPSELFLSGFVLPVFECD